MPQLLAITRRARRQIAEIWRLANEDGITVRPMFLSPILMAKSVMPNWIRSVSQFNLVNWSVEAAATRAFRAYQRSA